jgi:hypothetical protein
MALVFMGLHHASTRLIALTFAQTEKSCSRSPTHIRRRHDRQDRAKTAAQQI